MICARVVLIVIGLKDDGKILTISPLFYTIKIEVVMKKIRYNNEDIYVDDTPLDIKETGIINRNIEINEEMLEKTRELPPISKDLLDDTLTDVWGE